MALLFYSLGAGAIAFLILLRAHKVLFKLFEIPPLLNFIGAYAFYNVFAEKLSTSVPETWQAKQFINLVHLEGSLGFVLHLDEPKMSAFDLTSATFGLLIIGYLVYVFAIKNLFKEEEEVTKPMK